MGEWRVTIGEVKREDLPQQVQAAMAAVEGAKIFADIAEGRGADLSKVHGPLPGIAGVWESRLADGLAVGSIVQCGHLSPKLPVPMIWLAWVPDRLSCVRCAEADARAIHGTPVDDICDGCGDTSPVIHIHGGKVAGGVIPARASQSAGRPLPLGHGPVIIQGGLCPPCAKADRLLVAPAAVDTRRVEPRPDSGRS